MSAKRHGGLLIDSAASIQRNHEAVKKMPSPCSPRTIFGVEAIGLLRALYRYRVPLRMTNTTRRIAVMSRDGSPATATRSAS